MKILLKDKNCWPIRAHATDAGLDLKSAEDTFVLKPGEIRAVGTSVCMEIPNGYVGLLFIRSSVGTKTNHVTIANGTGVIDSWYRGEIIAVLHNNGTDEETIEKYYTFCQLVIVPCITPEVTVVDELSKTKRGTNGFGSTTKLVDTNPVKPTQPEVRIPIKPIKK